MVQNIDGINFDKWTWSIVNFDEQNFDKLVVGFIENTLTMKVNRENFLTNCYLATYSSNFSCQTFGIMYFPKII